MVLLLLSPQKVVRPPCWHSERNEIGKYESGAVSNDRASILSFMNAIHLLQTLLQTETDADIDRHGGSTKLFAYTITGELRRQKQLGLYLFYYISVKLCGSAQLSIGMSNFDLLLYSFLHHLPLN